MLNEDDARYNNKADIFALGCILCEIASGKKLFFDDLVVKLYSLEKPPPLPNAPPFLPVNVWELVKTTLNVDPLLRPSAQHLLESLYYILEYAKLATKAFAQRLSSSTTIQADYVDIPPTNWEIEFSPGIERSSTSISREEVYNAVNKFTSPAGSLDYITELINGISNAHKLKTSFDRTQTSPTINSPSEDVQRFELQPTKAASR